MINLFLFRDMFTKKQKWYFAIPYFMIMTIGLISFVIIDLLNLFCAFLDLLSIGSN